MILVTGGAGFIGSHLADALLAAGHEVRVLDVLHPLAHDGIPDYLDPRIDLRLGSVADRDAVAAALEGVDAVAHLAAMVGLGTDITVVSDFVHHNDLGTAVLLGELARTGFGGRLALASSMVVYGEGRNRCSTHGLVAPGPRDPVDLDAGRFDPPCPICGRTLVPEPVPEHAPTDPRSVYAATKLHQEHLGAAFARETDVPVTTLRYHNVYGPRMPRDTPYAGVASIFRSSLASGNAPQVFEDGAQRRDFVHVRDVARANVRALTGGADGAGVTGTFNVCSGVPRSVGEMAASLVRAFGPDAPAPQTTGAYRLGDVRNLFASAEHATQDLGFVATEDFDAGMAEFARAELRGAPAG